MVAELLKMINGVQPENRTIAIITPYAAQVRVLKEMVQPFLDENPNIGVGMVDSYQGREANIVILSCV